MIFEPSTMKTAGLAYAHALWNLSDMEPGNTLVPLAFTEGRKGRELLRFDAKRCDGASKSAGTMAGLGRLVKPEGYAIFPGMVQSPRNFLLIRQDQSRCYARPQNSYNEIYD